VTVFIPGKSPGGRVLKTIDFCPQVPKLSHTLLQSRCTSATAKLKKKGRTKEEDEEEEELLL
jgi:hypothetical protein